MVGWNPNDWLSLQNDELWQGISCLNNPCPKSFRIPTIYEWEAERKSWMEVNSEGAFESPLKLTAAGHRIPITGDLGNVGRDGEYWSSTVDKANAKNLYFNDLYSEIQSSYRASGISVRCIKD